MIAPRMKRKHNAQAERLIQRMAFPTEVASAMMPAISGAVAEPMDSMKY